MSEHLPTDERGTGGRRDRRRRALLWTCAAFILACAVFLVWSRDRGDESASTGVPPSSSSTAAPTATDFAPGVPRSGPGPRARGRTRAENPDDPTTPSAAPAPVADGTTGASIEVVTEDGTRCREGTVEFLVHMLEVWRRPSLPNLPPASLADGNPVLVRGPPDVLDGLELVATADVPGLANATARFTMRRDHIESVRLVVPRGRTAEVSVLDEDGVTPVAGASVVSTTELQRRETEPEAVRGTAGPGRAVSGADGRCVVTDLGPGEHSFEIDAPEHVRGRAIWKGGSLVVRLLPIRGTGTVTVTVIGPDGRPAAGVVVRLIETDRKVETAADGRARFDSVPAGFRGFLFEMPSGPEFRRWAEKAGASPTMVTEVAVEPGGDHAAALGLRRGGVSFLARIVDEDGAPIPGAKVTLMCDLTLTELVADGGGVVRLADLPPSTLRSFVDPGSGGTWFFSDVELQRTHVTRTWKLGKAAIRGRVVKGPVDGPKTPVAGARISVKCLADADPVGLVSSGSDGRFEIGGARRGRYRVWATSESAADHRASVDVDVPSEDEVVVELIECGRVAVRFLATDRVALREATIELRSEAGAGPPLGAPGSDDADRVAELVLPGTYEVVVALGGRTRTFPAEVKGGTTTVVEVGAP